MTTTTTTTKKSLTVLAIDPARLHEIHSTGHDERGNPIRPFAAAGWEPLRCCLTLARAGEAIALIAYSPFATASPWSETGPVYVHPTACSGYPTNHALPDQLRTGPKILRTYRADGTLDYDHVTLVEPGTDIEEPLRTLLAIDEITTIHVRALHTQCFGYAVTR
jgi:hypothetical protein